MNTLHSKAQTWANKNHGLYINGQWQSGSASFACSNPATGDIIASIAKASEADVDLAVSAARDSLRSGWGQLSRADKNQKLRAAADLIRENSEELAAIISLENGKLYRESLHDDMPDTAAVFEYYAGWIDKHYGETAPVEPGFINYINREPMGVCGLIVPWNFPLLLAMWKLAPALAMGNTVVIKPSEETPLSLLRTLELFDQANIFPAGTINLVTGDGKVGQWISSHMHIDKISFTGSTATGKQIVSAAGLSNLKTVSLELGGKAPVLIFDDLPDFDAAVDRCFEVAFSQKGEKCTEPTRLLIQDSLYDRFAQAVVEKAKQVRCGDPFDTSSSQGAQCSLAHYDKIVGYITQGIADGAKLLCGGVPTNDNDLYIAPTIFGEVDNSLAIARDEIFGPVLILQRFSDEQQAIDLANDSCYGLAAGIYTANTSRAHRVAAALDAGQIFVNRYGCYDFSSPFGGFKQSGWGKEMGVHSLEAYTRTKSVWIAY